MKTSKARILDDLQRFEDATNEAPKTVCRKVTGDGRFYTRLCTDGSVVSVDTVDALYAYMTENCPSITNPMLGDHHD